MMFIVCSARCIIQILLNDRTQWFCLRDHGHAPASRERIVKSESKEKVHRKEQWVPQSQTVSNPRHEEKEKKDKNEHVQNKRTNAREAYWPAPSSQIEVIIMLKGMKHENNEQGKTIKHEAPRSINHKATQNKDNIGTTAIERSLA